VHTEPTISASPSLHPLKDWSLRETRCGSLYVFGKNERDNITEQERVALSEIGDKYLGLPSEKLDELVAKGTLIEVVCDGDEKEDEPNPC
jgi:hypothetical protein